MAASLLTGCPASCTNFSNHQHVHISTVGPASEPRFGTRGDNDGNTRCSREIERGSWEKRSANGRDQTRVTAGVKSAWIGTISATGRVSMPPWATPGINRFVTNV